MDVFSPTSPKQLRQLQHAFGLAACLILVLMSSGCGLKSRQTTDFEYSTTTRTIHITALQDDLLRIQGGSPATEEVAVDRNWVIPVMPEAKGRLHITERNDDFLLTTSALKIVVRKTDVGVLIYNQSDILISEDIRVPTQGNRIETRKKLHLSHSFYGMGLKTGSLNKLGHRFEMWNSDPLEDGNLVIDEDPLYQSHPFLLCVQDSLAYGLLLNNCHRSTFDIGYSSPDELRISADGGALDYLFLYGPQPTHVLESLTLLIGKAALPPRWALGLQVPFDRPANAESILNLASKWQERGFPLDAIWLDHTVRKSGRLFTWDEQRLGDSQELISSLRQKGVNVIGELDPGVKYSPNAGYEVFDEGVRGDLFLTSPDGHFFKGEGAGVSAAFPDVTMPEARTWWAKQIIRSKEIGYSGLWITRSEPLAGEPDTGMPPDIRFYGEGIRTDLREAHNIYPNLFAEATRNGLKQVAPTDRLFLASRAGFSGIHRYGITWTGEVPSSWTQLDMVPATLMNLSLSGVGLAGTDIGGSTRINDPELYIRWLQVSVFTPILRHRPISTSETSTPWSFGTQVERAAKKALTQRYRMTPLWYSLMYDYVKTGIPLMRPLLLDPEFMTDPNVRNMNDQWMIGSDLLVAPVIERGSRTRTVYLPVGTWTELRTDRIYEGPVRVTVDAPIESIPLFARSMAILPSWPYSSSLSSIEPDSLIFDLYPNHRGETGEFTLTCDDGKSEEGGNCRTLLRLSRSDANISLALERQRTGSFSPPEAYLLMRFHHVAESPAEVVMRAGAENQMKLLYYDGAPLPFGWTWEEKNKIVEVLLPQQNEKMMVSLILKNGK